MKCIQFLLVPLLVFSACSTPVPSKHAPMSLDETPRQSLSLQELQNRLGIQMGLGETGYREMSFNACDLGRALSDLKPPLKDCHRAYFVLVQFQLACRQSDQPNDVLGADDLTPLRNKNLKWKVGNTSGETQTDFQGQAVIRSISSETTQNAFLRISTGVDFLNMRVKQATSIATPPSWCQ
jgi:hypothetical protein